MAIINNHSARVGELTAAIESAASNLILADVSAGKNACEQVAAEEDCEHNYGEGQRFAGNLQTHVSKAGNYIQQISDTFEQADQAAVLRAMYFEP